MIDFTDCEIDKTANYGGSDQKRGIIYDGRKYMLKLSDRIPEEKRNPLNSSYTNSAFSEYIGCHILESAGFDVQNTLLGNLTVVGRSGADRVHPVVACENFVPDGYSLVEFKTIESALLSRKPPKIPEIGDIYGILTHENAYFGKDFGMQALERYWDLFIMDALLGNFDRHANNWGYLINDSTENIQFAPVYDCGSCLYPQLTDDALDNILSSREEIQMRIEKFPQAALTGEDGKKISYLRYIASFANPDCTEALLRVFPKIDLSEINRIVDATEGISDIRKTFYKTMLAERYEQILERPYQQLLTKGTFSAGTKKDMQNTDVSHGSLAGTTAKIPEEDEDEDMER